MVIDFSHIDVGTLLTILTIIIAATTGFVQLREGIKSIQRNYDSFTKRIDNIEKEVSELIKVTEGLAAQTKRLDTMEDKINYASNHLTEVMQVLKDYLAPDTTSVRVRKSRRAGS